MMRAACLTCSSLVVNVHTKSFATIIPQYVSSYCFIEDDRAVASFHIWYFEGDILDLYLMTSQNIASSSLGIALELPHSNRQISIIFQNTSLYPHAIVLHITYISITSVC